MELSVSEAARILGISPRTLRARLARGELPGVKRGGHWQIPSRSLPMTETQRQALQARADEVRGAVEKVLPTRMARSRGDKARILLDLDAFRLGAELLESMRAAPETPGVERAAALLHDALLDVAEAAHVYDRGRKLFALDQARASVGRASAALILSNPRPPPEPAHGWVHRLEGQVGPSIAGYARWVARLPGRQ